MIAVKENNNFSMLFPLSNVNVTYVLFKGSFFPRILAPYQISMFMIKEYRLLF